MDIQKAASYGWKKGSAITMVLRNLTTEEFRRHSYLDTNLSDNSPVSIYHMKTNGRVKKRVVQK